MFTVFASIAIIVLVYFTLHPTLIVTPVPSTDPGAAFATTFNLKNKSVSDLYTFSSAYCVNSFQTPNGSQAAIPSNFRFGMPGQSVSMDDLARGDTTALPVENNLSGPPGSRADIVFILTFQPGWSIDLFERRFRFQGTENPDKSWTWKQVPLGSACG